MGLNLEAFEAFKKQAGQSSGSSSSSSSSSSAGSSSSSGASGSRGSVGTDNSVFSKSTDKTDKKEDSGVLSAYQEILDERYKDDDNLSARDAFSKLTQAGILNEQYYDRMICAAEKLVNNDQWVISMADENGNISDMALADAVAASFDSEIDLYIQDVVAEVMAKYGTCSKGYTSDAARKELAAKGIRIDSVGADDGSITNRVYSFSLVELPPNASEMTEEELLAAVYSDDAQIIEDKAGNKASYLFADCLIPDGFAQNAEVNLSSILDTMGYDCISKADFIDSDVSYEDVMAEVKDYLNSGDVQASGTIHDIFGNVKEIAQSVKDLWGGSGAAPGQFGTGGGSSDGKISEEQAKAEEEKAIKDKYDEILEDKKAEYKEEYGEEASGSALEKLQKEAQNEAKTIAKNQS